MHFSCRLKKEGGIEGKQRPNEPCEPPFSVAPLLHCNVLLRLAVSPTLRGVPPVGEDSGWTTFTPSLYGGAYEPAQCYDVFLEV